MTTNRATKTQRETFYRYATADEVAAYKLAVQRFVDAHDVAAIIDVRCKMKMMFTSRGFKIKVRATRAVS